MTIFYYYPTCSTCKKAKKWLDEHEITYLAKPIHEQPPTTAELKKIWHQSQQPLKKFFNTSGLKYRELNLKTVLPTLDDEEQLNLLASDGMLIKRPLLVSEHFVLIGFRLNDWEAVLQ